MRKFFTLLAIVFAFGLFLAGCDNNKVKVTFDLNYEGAPARAHKKNRKRFKSKRTD